MSWGNQLKCSSTVGIESQDFTFSLRDGSCEGLRKQSDKTEKIVLCNGLS